MAIQWKIEGFWALTVNELYDLLKLRGEIFVSGVKLHLS
jgi:ElaA protein